MMKIIGDAPGFRMRNPTNGNVFVAGKKHELESARQMQVRNYERLREVARDAAVLLNRKPASLDEMFDALPWIPCPPSNDEFGWFGLVAQMSLAKLEGMTSDRCFVGPGLMEMIRERPNDLIGVEERAAKQLDWHTEVTGLIPACVFAADNLLDWLDRSEREQTALMLSPTQESYVLAAAVWLAYLDSHRPKQLAGKAKPPKREDAHAIAVAIGWKGNAATFHKHVTEGIKPKKPWRKLAELKASEIKIPK